MTPPDPKPRYGDATLYRRLFRESKHVHGHLVGLFFLSLLAAPISLLMPLPVKIVVDHVLGGQALHPTLAHFVPDGVQGSPTSMLWFACGLVMLAALLIQVQDLAAWVYKTWIGERLKLGFRARLFDHMQRLSLGFHHQKGTADSIYRLQFDAPSIQSVAIDGVIPFATALVKVVVLVIVTLIIDWQLALIALLGGPLLFGITELYRKKLRRRWSAVREYESTAMGVVHESLSAVRVVKAFGQEERETKRFRTHATRTMNASIRAALAHGTFDLIVGVVVGGCGAAILYVGAQHVIEGKLTLGNLLLIMAYLSQLFQPLREVGTRLASMQSSLASAERVFSVLDERPDAQNPEHPVPLERAKGHVEYRGVHFAYVEGEPILSDVNEDIPAGSRVGVAGKTGSGKSTILSLLPRFYDPQQGVILLDGVDIRQYAIGDLRDQFGIVLQEAVLFSTTIGENIAYGRPGATQAEIEQAAKNAAAHEFISELPDGYNTEVGERGARLSGGERQRVSLARAFLRDSPILILDEPTSALDTGTEEQVMEALERLMKGRTTFMIAHRLTTLADCNVRLQLRDHHVYRRDDNIDDVEFE